MDEETYFGVGLVDAGMLLNYVKFCVFVLFLLISIKNKIPSSNRFCSGHRVRHVSRPNKDKHSFILKKSILFIGLVITQRLQVVVIAAAAKYKTMSLLSL